jgi:alginate production protein
MTQPSLHSLSRLSLALPALTAASLALLPLPAGAVESDLSIKLKAGALSEDARDLGTGTTDDTRASFLDLQPQLLTQFGTEFSHFVRLQAFVPSDMVVQNEQDEPVPVENYAAVREFWVEYGGITSYPGEVLRLGLQRLRTLDGIWWDRDIESARWIFDTTLFQFEMGAAKAFDNYRTDNVELSESQRDRAYGFAGLSTQWLPTHYVGVRGAYATDQRELPPTGSQMELTSTQTDPDTGATVNTYRQPELRNYGWLGVYIDNKFYEWDRGPGMMYRFELIGMTGDREHVVTDPSTGMVTGTASQDVTALGGEAGLRARFPDAFPLTFGGNYAYGQGGSDDNGSHVFRQTGLQSNRSRFTGTRTMLNRFNEALQADLSNLRVLSAYVSMPLANWDYSVVGHRFQRDDASSPVSTDGIDARPDPDSTSLDLGTGFDFVLTYHFAQAIRQYFAAEDDTRSNIRLRASRFRPGEAYDPSLNDQTRVTLEGTLWF